MLRIPTIGRSPLLSHLRLLWHAAPGLSTACAALSILQASALVAVMICSGRLIGAITARDGSAVSFWSAAAVAVFVAGPLMASVSRGLEELVGARYLGAYQDLLLDTSVGPHTVDQLQTEAGSEVLDQASGALQHWLFLRGVGGFWGVLANKVTGIGALIIVAGWHWWVAILLTVGWVLLSRAVARWRSIVLDDSEDVALPVRHRASYLAQLVAARRSAKEIRLFGLADRLVGAYVDHAREAMDLVARNRGRGVRGTVPPLVLVLILHVGAFALLIRDIGAGLITVAALTTLVQAVLALSAFGRQDDDETSLGRTTSELARLINYRRELGLPFPVRTAHQATPKSSATLGPAAIEIDDLTFGYPGQQIPVLQGLNLSIKAGECVAVVGANGAGKSTLLSLLCGLWRPWSGTIAIDGRDPVDDHEARRRIAPIFQQFLRFPITAAENVTAGNGWLPGTSWESPAGVAGADTVIERLAHGSSTVLSTEFSGGTELSGGQWQRVALARAFAGIEAGAGILALDEPTAALDVRAEVALFESVLTRRGRATTILITHRLSSVRHVDRIVVLGRPAPDQGARVVESGTHQELMRSGGIYAEMFGLQASRFARSAS